jgi:hypothetical protein
MTTPRWAPRLDGGAGHFFLVLAGEKAYRNHLPMPGTPGTPPLPVGAGGEVGWELGAQIIRAGGSEAGRPTFLAREKVRWMADVPPRCAVSPSLTEGAERRAFCSDGRSGFRGIEASPSEQWVTASHLSPNHG